MSSTTKGAGYCPTCKVFCVLPNHCDNCGGKLTVAPAQGETADTIAARSNSHATQQLVERMVFLYRRDQARVAAICDEQLDQSGELLGYLRDISPPSLTEGERH